MNDTITIARRFQGPPSSGNGGYSCGSLAGCIEGPAVVRLKSPPPLETPLQIQHDGEVARLMNGDQVVAEARPTTLDVKPPDPPSFAEALTASETYRGFEKHWYPRCFVCGPKREPGDGLCIFPGPVPGRELVASTWIPDPSLDDGNGRVRHEFIWSALDCPGGYAFPPPAQGAILLGELAVSILDEIRIGEKCIAIGWEIAHEGRKHFVGTALFNDARKCVGVGRGVWIEVAQAAP